MKTLLYRLLPLALLALPASASEMPKIQIEIRQHKIVAEVAATEATRAKGLMHRFSLPPDQGMIFVFPGPQGVAMWMRNTFIPLSVAFIDAEGRILNIADMQPKSEELHASAGLAVYALEMRQGWFKERGLGPGEVVKGLAKAGAAKN
ncbi:hypothetical protein BURK2_01744 [Burkholderiales bacterium]|nr:MAG: DUF192 domain-containing protein [Burkholderiales bacterium]CAG0979193.1 hypothetical protein BURK2_01744 [Burkholderiales bacterium]